MSTTQRKAIRRKDIGEPRYGLSGYLKFMEEFRLSDELKRLIEAEGDKITKANKATFTAKKGGEKWNMMSQSEKDVSWLSSLIYSLDVLVFCLFFWEGRLWRAEGRSARDFSR